MLGEQGASKSEQGDYLGEDRAQTRQVPDVPVHLYQKMIQ